MTLHKEPLSSKLEPSSHSSIFYDLQDAKDVSELLCLKCFSCVDTLLINGGFFSFLFAFSKTVFGKDIRVDLRSEQSPAQGIVEKPMLANAPVQKHWLGWSRTCKVLRLLIRS